MCDEQADLVTLQVFYLGNRRCSIGDAKSDNGFHAGGSAPGGQFGQRGQLVECPDPSGCKLTVLIRGIRSSAMVSRLTHTSERRRLVRSVDPRPTDRDVAVIQRRKQIPKQTGIIA